MMNLPNEFRLLAIALSCMIAAPSALWAQAEVSLEDVEIPEGDECVACHVDLDYLPDGFSPNDIHFVSEISCVGCHGGDSSSDDEDVAMSAQAGFVGIPDPTDIPAFCGKCHSDPAYMRRFQPSIRIDQEAQFHNSGHGKRLAEGDTEVANCASCHTAHAILPASDPRSTVHDLNVPAMCDGCHGDQNLMADYGLEHDIFTKYAVSVHGMALLEAEDVGAPACNDCHGNHGALPPEVTSLAEVCGTCHPNNQALFQESPMAQPFLDAGFEACVECHGHHAIAKPHDEMVGVGEASVCTDCHGPGDSAYDEAVAMYEALTNLVTLSDSAASLRAHVARIGMDDVDIEFLLKDAHQSLVQARTRVHSFEAETVVEETDVGVEKALEAIEMADQQIEEHRNRRLGFAIAAFFATLLVIALFLKIKDVERGSPYSE